MNTDSLSGKITLLLLDFLGNVNLQITEKDSLYCTAMLTQLAYAVLSIWVNTGCHESSDELYEIMKHEMKLIYTYL